MDTGVYSSKFHNLARGMSWNIDFRIRILHNSRYPRNIGISSLDLEFLTWYRNASQAVYLPVLSREQLRVCPADWDLWLWTGRVWILFVWESDSEFFIVLSWMDQAWG